MTTAFLSILHEDRDHERYTFRCPHGRTERAAATIDWRDTRDVIRQLAGDHDARYRCGCDPAEIADRWTSLSDAQESYDYDALNPPDMPRTAQEDERWRARHDEVRNLGCSTCQPGLVMYEILADRSALPIIRLIHQPACERYEDPFLALDGGGAW